MLPVALGILGLQGPEILLILFLVLLLFGATKIPQLARNLGRAKGEFQKGAREGGTGEESDEEKTLQAARDLGIPTEGRPLDDVKRDIRERMSH